MQITVERLATGNIVSACVEHRGQRLMWNIGMYVRSTGRSNTVALEDIFNEINRYWQTRPIEEQDAIWHAYSHLRDLMDDPSAYSQILPNLRTWVGELYKTMDLDDLRHWVVFHSGIRLPDDLNDVHDTHVPIGRTYLRTDYLDLVVFSIALRPMVPIWGEFIEETKIGTGGNFKEYVAMSLMYSSSLVESQAYRKLETYVDLTLAAKRKEDRDIVAIIGGLSESEFTQWIISFCVTRRLAIGSVNSTDGKNNLVSSVYNAVTNNWDNVQRTFGRAYGGKIARKNPVSKNEEDKTSFIELYKIKQPVSDGSIEVLSVYTENHVRMAMELYPEINLDRLELCMRDTRQLARVEIATELIPLIQWTLCRVLPARAIPLLNRHAIMRCMAVAQAVLWDMGYPDLAALVTATKIRLPEDIHINAPEPKSRIPKNLQDEMDFQYPYFKRINAKQESARKKNMAYIAIDTFCDQTKPFDWQLHCPDELIADMTTEVKNRRCSMPIDIRIQLSKLFLYSVSRAYTNPEGK